MQFCRERHGNKKEFSALTTSGLEAFTGPTILAYFDRLFNGRKLTLLGYNRQRIPGNWKLMQENIKATFWTQDVDYEGLPDVNYLAKP